MTPDNPEPAEVKTETNIINLQQERQRRHAQAKAASKAKAKAAAKLAGIVRTALREEGPFRVMGLRSGPRDRMSSENREGIAG